MHTKLEDNHMCLLETFKWNISRFTQILFRYNSRNKLFIKFFFNKSIDVFCSICEFFYDILTLSFYLFQVCLVSLKLFDMLLQKDNEFVIYNLVLRNLIGRDYYTFDRVDVNHENSSIEHNKELLSSGICLELFNLKVNDDGWVERDGLFLL